VRLSGAASAVHAAQAKLGGEALKDADAFWQRLRDQATPFFDKRRPLWRLAVKPTTPPLNLGDAQWIEWGGAVRWLASGLPPAALREAAKAAGGHATLFRGDAPADGVFTPLAPALLTLHRNLKQRFDPRGIFNRGRLYLDF
jgi:glycolate oxidase FAD binding subunit